MSISSSAEEERETEVLLDIVEVVSSGEDPPKSEWSSLEIDSSEENEKRLLFEQGVYSPGSGEICMKNIAISDSEVFKHPYYKYPAVTDPGIKIAILSPEKPIIYPDDGQELYLALCLEMKMCPVRIFQRSLVTASIDLSYYGVNPFGVRPMAIALQYNKSVRSFNLTENFLNDDACYHLGQMLSSNVTLQEINLTGCRIGASGLLRLGNSLHVNRTLATLNLARNNIGEDGGLHIAKQISDGAVVKHFNLSNNQLGKMTAMALAVVFKFNNKYITHLDLSWNNFFHAPSTAKLLEQIANSNVLQELNLAWNSLEGERIANAVASIMRVPNLMILDLSNNRFKEEAIPLILSNLFKAKKLVTLDLSFNPLTPSDAYLAIEKMLKPRVKLENLLLDNVWVQKEFLVCLKKVQQMKSRKNFVIKYGGVLKNWQVKGADPRELILKRANYLGNLSKRNKVDIALFFLTVAKETPKPIPVKDLIDRVADERVPLDDGLITELSVIFPGPKSAKSKSINLQTLCEYMQRLWPDKKLPPTPPPEPEPEPEPESEPVPENKKDTKGKKKK